MTHDTNAAERNNETTLQHHGKDVGGPWTIAGWCERWKISAAYFYKMQRDGSGPKTFRKDGIVRITPEADAEFKNRYENPESEEHQRSKRARQEHASKAAKKAIRSDRHISKRSHRRQRGCAAAKDAR